MACAVSGCAEAGSSGVVRRSIATPSMAEPLSRGLSWVRRT